jgi:ubiquinone biosynthesis protein
VLFARLVHGLALIAWLGPQYFFNYLLSLVWRAPTRPYRRWLDRHGAQLFVAHAKRYGALMIKLGQFVASRPDIFPLVYVDACAPLRDQAPARPFSVVQQVLNDAYEGRINQHFSRVEETALAAASFGQVHRAWLPDGQLVAVKIQYPELPGWVAADLFLVRVALQLFGLILRGWPLQQIYDEIARTSKDEQDYLHEGSAADKLRDKVAPFGLSIPRVIWAHTREKVLVMEFAGGTTLGQTAVETLSDDERQRIAEVLIDSFLCMLLDLGFFHADPHSGNILYDNGKIWLIDFGMTATLEKREMALYRRFLGFLRDNNTDGMVDVLSELGWTLPHADRAQLKRLAREVYDSLAHLDPQTFKGSRRQTELSAKIAEFLRRMDGIVFPQHTVLLSRATSLIEGVCMQLIPGKNILDLVRPRLGKLTTVRGEIERIASEIKTLWRAYQQLPDKVDALLQQQQRNAAPFPGKSLVAGLLLIALLQCEPSPWRDGTAIILAAVLGITLLKRQ